jgi:universal stress protein E
MNRICNILVIVDPTADEHPAVDKGALLAEKFDARLELFICDTKASRDARLAAHASGKPVVLDLKARLEMLADPLRQRGLDVTTETSRSDPLCEGLIDRTRRTNAELVIKDTHHHSLAQRTFLTNTDWQLIRGCPVPLLLTKPKSWADAPRIVAAVDPGHANDKPVLLDHCILEEAAAVAQRLNGELHVMHVYLPMAIVATATAVPPVAFVSPEALEEEREAKLKTISALLSDYKVDVKHIHLEIGGPGAVLPRAAREINADIVAMGAISRSGVKRVFIGSTAEDVLEHLPCDALIVKTPNFAELLPI